MTAVRSVRGEVGGEVCLACLRPADARGLGFALPPVEVGGPSPAGPLASAGPWNLVCASFLSGLADARRGPRSVWTGKIGFGVDTRGRGVPRREPRGFCGSPCFFTSGWDCE